MAGKYERKRSRFLPYAVVVILVAALAGGSIFLTNALLSGKDKLPTADASQGVSMGDPTGQAPTAEPTETTEPETTAPPEPEHVVATASIGAMGDLLMHKPIYHQEYNAACFQGNGVYDFTGIFQYVKPYTSALDVAVANLETTLAGSDRAYSGFPAFNTPDSLLDAVVDAGYDVMLTANNHCFDTQMQGYQRTLEVCKDKGLDTLGTMASAEDPKYMVRDVNGIQLGLVCYTYETTDGTGSYPALNGNPMYQGSYDMINTFAPTNPQPFYTEIEGYIQEMRDAGADQIILFIHWGVEYQTYANNDQKNMAQKLCDLGVDVIIGGHPHVIQPMELLTSTVDENHKTVCLYSLGNALSNQRTGGSSLFPAGYVEDGMLFTVNFEKYSDGTVYLRSAEVLPTWVIKFQNGDYKNEYQILPLDDSTRDRWTELYGIGPNSFSAAEKSYNRTIGLVGEGLAQCMEYLDAEKISRDQYYYDLAYGVVEPDTAPTETMANAA